MANTNQKYLLLNNFQKKNQNTNPDCHRSGCFKKLIAKFVTVTIASQLRLYLIKLFRYTTNEFNFNLDVSVGNLDFHHIHTDIYIYIYIYIYILTLYAFSRNVLHLHKTKRHS